MSQHYALTQLTGPWPKPLHPHFNLPLIQRISGHILIQVL